jgi:hypothetical protein
MEDDLAQSLQIFRRWMPRGDRLVPAAPQVFAVRLEEAGKMSRVGLLDDLDARDAFVCESWRPLTLPFLNN